MTLADQVKVTTAYTAAINALVASEQLEHAIVLTAELLGRLEGGAWEGRLVHRDLKPENVSAPAVHEPAPIPAPTSSVACPGAKAAPMTGAERMRALRVRKRQQFTQSHAAEGGQLELPVTASVTRVTERDESDAAAVTRHVTPSLSCSDASPQGPFQGPEGDAEKTLERRDDVTVTPLSVTAGVTLPAEPEGADRSIFAKGLRPGVDITVEQLWKKFREHGYSFLNGAEQRFTWGTWCRNERPERRAAAPPARDERPKGKDRETLAPAPAPRSAPVDPEERSRRVEAEYRERRAREAAEHRERALPAILEGGASLLAAVGVTPARRSA